LRNLINFFEEDFENKNDNNNNKTNLDIDTQNNLFSLINLIQSIIIVCEKKNFRATNL
jgi:hypothetical protein